MTDPLSNPRVLELLQQAENAVKLKQEMRARKESISDVEEALEGIYRDLGRYVHGALQHAPKDSPPAPAPKEQRTEEIQPTLQGAFSRSVLNDENELPEITETHDLGSPDTDESWFTDEVEIDEGNPPLFTQDDDTDIPEADPLTEHGEADVGRVVSHLADSPPRGATEVRSLSDIEASKILDGPLGNLHGSSEPWAQGLQEFLELLALPTRLDDTEELAVESSRIQWATTDLENLFEAYPPEIQLVLIGLLAARARHLQTQLDSDVGPRMAIDRLDRFRVQGGLPALAPLAEQCAPECGSWPLDIGRWWALLDTSGSKK